MAAHVTAMRLADHLGKSLRAARHKAKLTQEKVAELVDLSPEVYGRMERGKGLPSLETLTKLCRVLQADANVVLALGAHEPLTWRDDDKPLQEDSRRVRRLLALLRQMDEHQVAALHSMAQSLLKRSSERRQGAAARR